MTTAGVKRALDDAYSARLNRSNPSSKKVKVITKQYFDRMIRPKNQAVFDLKGEIPMAKKNGKNNLNHLLYGKMIDPSFSKKIYSPARPNRFP